ncbi:MAG: ParB/RepB/Spo0J family partition protein [Chlamydiae bacterium]|nr:ParB/RepB/Spo0J family partition protein [Chlamydiota bacterium]MBI3266214.1 ParB/RepB/Spo0J family partition protein [Chlamydiota bacterium]
MAKQALGKGLGALIQNTPIAGPDGKVESVDIQWIDLNPQQPRKDFDEASLIELKESLKTSGLLQPILVRRHQSRYELIAGERRLRAAKALGWTRIPALVKEATDEASLQMALIENIQRQNLGLMEEARAYMRLMRDYELTQDSVAEKVGKNRATVANFLRLLSLPKEIQEMMEKGDLTFGHAKAILGLSNSQDQIKWAQEVVKRGLSVREIEERVQVQKKPFHRKILKKNPELKAMEEKLEEALHTKVYIKHGQKKGKIEIEYYSVEDLERIVEAVSS